MYHTYEQLKTRLPEEDLVALVDDERNGVIVQDPPNNAYSRVVEIGESVAGLIDSYCRGRYSVPFTGDIPDIIVDISLDLHAYRLYKRRQDLTSSDEQQRRWKNAIGLLNQIQNGDIRLFDERPSPPRYDTNKSAADRTFSKERMKLF
jgi:phage gp36-like protein